MAAVSWAREQSWAIDSKILVAGNSVGGLTSAALAATNPAGVVAYINFAGGIAGNPDQAPGKSCAPEKVREAYALYGKTTRIPSLWLYAALSNEV
jgi:dienelactone hydrolase